MKSTTAFDDQFTPATQNPVVVREAYDTVAILRRNIADMEKELQRQSTMASHWRQQYAIIYDEMQGTPCAEIRWQHERKELTERAEAAEGELEAVREDNHNMMTEINELRTERDELAVQKSDLAGRILYMLEGVYGDTVVGDRALKEARTMLQSAEVTK